MKSKEPSKFDRMLLLLQNNDCQIKKLQKEVSILNRRMRRQSYQFTLMILLFLVIILGTIIILTG